jgi:hypothetical protein
MLDATHPSAAYFVLFAGMILAYMIAASVLVTRIERRHTAIWTALGRPSVFEGNPLVVLRILRFIFSRRYKETNDIQLGILIWTVRFLLTTTIFLLLWSIQFS